jgi:Skp family chaperone for outer membrane proteins
MMKMNKMIASLLCAGVLASASAFADDAAVPQGNVDKGVAVEQLKQDRATMKTDRSKLQSDRQKLKEDRAKLGRKGHKHKKRVKKQAQEPAAAVQPQG